MSPLDLLTFAVLALVGARLVTAARISFGTRTHVRVIVSGLRPRHFLWALPILIAVLTLALALIQLPVLSFGWWTAIGGSGNPVVGATNRTAGTPLETILPLVFITLLIPGLPVFVEREEQMFRAGAERRSFWGNLKKSVEFGLVHAIVGIPIGVAIALSIGGLYFTWAYLGVYRAHRSPELALLESTRCHLGYNMTVLTLAVVYLVIVAIHG
jgi:hypothetical protein